MDDGEQRNKQIQSTYQASRSSANSREHRFYRHPIRHRSGIHVPERAVLNSWISFPEVEPKLILPLRDLDPGALIHEGDAPVAVDLEHAVGHAAKHLSNLACF